MTKNIRNAAFAILASLTLAVFLVPGVEAQSQLTTTPNFQVETPTQDPSGAIVPDTGMATISVPWEYVIDQAGFPATTYQASSTTINWDPPTCEGAGIVITGSLTSIVRPSQPTATDTTSSDEGEQDFTIQATQDAPGEQPIRCTFTANVDPLGSQVLGAGPRSTTHNIVVEFLGLISASVPGTIKQAGPQKEIKYDIDVTNLGNARATIKFDLLNADGKGKWDPVTPSEIILDAPTGSGGVTNKVVSFQVSTPFKNGWNNDQTTFQLRITPVSTKDVNKEGTSVTVNVLSRVRGVYVPTLEPLVMVGAVLGSALVVRRLNQDE